MPGPCNSKKKRKQQTVKGKAQSRRSALKDFESQVSEDHALESAEDERTRIEGPGTVGDVQASNNWRITKHSDEITFELPARSSVPDQPDRPGNLETTRLDGSRDVRRPPSTGLLDHPFVSDPGNGPRVKDAGAFLSSFFCPPPSFEDETCAAFLRSEVLRVLGAVLPREVALIVWYNKTRKLGRICPSCQRLYRVGDALADPITDAPVDVYDPETPQQVLREQQISGICSSACFLLASYTSHPYVGEVARGAWGLLSHELDAQTRSLLDATDPATAGLIRYGRAAWDISQGLDDMGTVEDQGLGRVLRMTRRLDLGLKEMLAAPGSIETGEGEREQGGREVEPEERGTSEDRRMRAACPNTAPEGIPA